MTCRRLMILFGVAGLVASVCSGGDCDPQDTLRRFLGSDRFKTLVRERLEGDAKKSLVIMTLDHRTRAWHAYRCAVAASCTLKEDVHVEWDLDANAPRLRLRRNDRVLLVVTNTDPLAFALDSETVAYADAKQLQALQEVVTALTGTLGGILRRDRTVKILTVATRDDVERLRMAAEAVNKLIHDVSADTESAVSYVAAVEGGLKPGKPPVPTTSKADREKVQTLFTTLRQTADEVRKTAEACDVVREQAAEATKLRDLKPAEAKTAALHQLSVLRTETSCTAVRKAGLVSLLEAVVAGKDVASRIEGLAIMSADVKNALTAVDALIGGQRTTVAAVASLALFADRLETSKAADDGCDYATGVIVSRQRPEEVRFEKDGTVSFGVKPTQVFGVSIASDRQEITNAKFIFSSRAEALWGFGAGIVYTPLINPSWTAVQSPINSSEKVIARAKEEPSAGDIGVFANYRLPWFETWVVRPGLQVGAGVADRLEVFTGVSLELRPFLRVAAGRTWQQVDKLVPGQHELRQSNGEVDPSSLTVVASKDDIRTRKGFDWSWYVSLSFALDNLSVFKAKR